jgi:hypothetical protein
MTLTTLRCPPDGPRENFALEGGQTSVIYSPVASKVSIWILYLSKAKEATMSDGPDTPAQQLAAAEGLVDALPDEAKQGLAATVVQGLPAAQQQAAAQGVLDALPDDQRTQLAETVLGSPDKNTRKVLWYVVVSTLAAAVFVFGSMAFVLVYQKKAAEAPLALATTALGGIVGLVATSPGSRSGG